MSKTENKGSSLILLLFVLSGATGLIYEVVWVRQLSLLFGVSVYAVSAVLVAFMGGLGLGAALFGQLIDRGYAPLRLYAVMEFLIGLYILSFGSLLKILQTVYLLGYGSLADSPAAILTFRFLLAVSILMVPTILMGGTLPALIRYFTQNGSSAGATSGALYGLNTFGALAGCVIAGFYLIEIFGLTTTLRIGASINLILAVVAWGVAAEPGWRVTEEGHAAYQTDSEPSATNRSLYFYFGLAGFCALALEVFWTRVLILTLNNTTYAFTLILAIFLGGIAFGSGVVSAWLRHRIIRADRMFAYFLMGVGLFGGMSIYGFGWYREVMAIFGETVAATGGVTPLSPHFFYSCLILIPATFLMGGSFPLAVAAFTNQNDATVSETIGGLVGRLYAVNTAGCVVGSIAAGYFFIPLVGVEGGILAVAWLAFIGGAGLLLSRSGPLWAVVTPALLLLPVTLSAFDASAQLAERLTSWKLDRGSDVIFFAEGPSATVLVSHTPYDLGVNRQPVDRLWINGDPIAGGFREALMLERLLAHAPLLLHPDPQTGLVICFGTGSTAGAALTHGLKQVTAVDVSPEVFDAAFSFGAANNNVMESPKLRKVVEDGRNFLLTTDEQFDYISAEPPPPSNAGVVSLYTVEFYRLAKARLTVGGIFSQWIPLHHLATTDYKSLMASFATVFPHGQVWYTKWDAILIGADEAIKIDQARIATGMQNVEVAESLAGIGITLPDQLLAHFFMGEGELAAYVNEVAPLYDDRPTVEFTAPQILASGVTVKGANLQSMMTYRSPPNIIYTDSDEQMAAHNRFLSFDHYLQGKLHENDNRMGEAARSYRQGLDLYANNNAARYAFLQLNLRTLYSTLGAGRGKLAQALLADTKKLDTDNLFSPQLHFLTGMFAVEGREYLVAEKELLRAVELDESWLVATLNLAGLYRIGLSRPDLASYYYKRALALPLTEEERQAIATVMTDLPGGEG